MAALRPALCDNSSVLRCCRQLGGLLGHDGQKRRKVGGEREVCSSIMNNDGLGDDRVSISSLYLCLFV